MLEQLINIDKDLFLIINQWNNTFFDQVMWYTSKSWPWVWVYLLLIYSSIKKYNIKWTGLVLVLVGLLIFLADSGSVHLFKNVFERLRPCHDPDLDGLVHLVNNKCGKRFGFISSHAANTGAIAVFFALLLKKRIWTIFLIFYALMISYSRVYLGVHFPGDVIGGMLWGGAMAGFVYFLFQTIYRKFV